MRKEIMISILSPFIKVMSAIENLAVTLID